MKNQRILLAVAWLASIVAAYFIGGFGSSSGSSAGHGGSVASANGKNGSSQSGGPGSSADHSPAQQGGDFAERQKLSNNDIAALVARARVEMAGGMRGMMNIRGMLKAMAPLADLDSSQIPEALAEIERTIREPDQKMVLYSLLLGQWAETDGKAALAYADEKLKGQAMFDMGVRASIVGSWARHDPDSVWRWFQSDGKNDGNERTQGMLTSMVFAGMAANDLDTALQRLSSLDDTTRAMALSGIASSASDQRSRERLLDRTAALPDDQRNQIRQSLIGQWAMSDPDSAVKWLHTLSADEQKPLRESAAQMMMMTKPAAGADLMMENATEEDKPRLYDRVVGQWAFQDPKATAEWLLKQPQGPELDNARRTYAASVAMRDPAGAMDWAKSVQNPDQRIESVAQIYSQWRMRDEAAADAALDTAGLPEDRVKQLKEMPKPQSPPTGGPFLTPPAVRVR